MKDINTKSGTIKKNKKVQCGRCHQFNVTVSSAFDGRPEYQCICGYYWTNGHKPNI